MKIKLSTEKWNSFGQPTVGSLWHFVKNKKKISFAIVEQGFTKDGVFLKLTKIKK